MLSSRGVTCLRKNVCAIVVRHGGGGGRPGGMPAFNWKEKMLLRLEKKAQRKKQSGGMKDYGFLEELGNEVNNIPMRPVAFPSKEDYLVPTNKLVGVDPASNGRTELNMSLIFGSSKPYGMLPSKPHKQRFSMKRVFDKETGVATSRVRSKAK